MSLKAWMFFSTGHHRRVTSMPATRDIADEAGLRTAEHFSRLEFDFMIADLVEQTDTGFRAGSARRG